MFDGIGAREERRHNDSAWLAWHIAFMSAYAPEQSKKFWKLKSFLWKAPTSVQDKPEKSRASAWRDSFSAFAAWAESKRKKS